MMNIYEESTIDFWICGTTTEKLFHQGYSFHKLLEKNKSDKHKSKIERHAEFITIKQINWRKY